MGDVPVLFMQFHTIKHSGHVPAKHDTAIHDAKMQIRTKEVCIAHREDNEPGVAATDVAAHKEDPLYKNAAISFNRQVISLVKVLVDTGFTQPLPSKRNC